MQIDDPFPKLCEVLIGKEGKYSNNPADAGGETMWGITHFTAEAFGYQGEMRNMSREQAIEIYRVQYWLQPHFDKLYVVDGPCAVRLFDIGVNMGQTTGAKFLQRALNALNQQGSDYPDIKVDGVVGAMTLNALNKLFRKRGQEGRRVLRGMIGAQHSVRYIEIAEAKPTQERFEFGWQSQRAILKD